MSRVRESDGQKIMGRGGEFHLYLVPNRWKSDASMIPVPSSELWVDLGENPAAAPGQACKSADLLVVRVAASKKEVQSQGMSPPIIDEPRVPRHDIINLRPLCMHG